MQAVPHHEVVAGKTLPRQMAGQHFGTRIDSFATKQVAIKLNVGLARVTLTDLVPEVMCDLKPDSLIDSNQRIDDEIVESDVEQIVAA
ncbi:hypothetical protein WS99_07385 [Burkholderia territorii]|nr:hypothetical protein WS99_07385 [Burkholderia territorii]